MAEDGIQWIAEVFDAYCVTFARDLDVAAPVRRLGGEPARVRRDVSVGEAFSWAMDQGSVALLGTCAGWAFAVELWSHEGAERGASERVSAGTESVVLVSSTGPEAFLHSGDGVLLASFEPGTPAEDWSGAAPDALRATLAAAGLLAGDGTPCPGHDTDGAWMLAAAERAFGLSLPRRTLEHGTTEAVLLP